MNKHVSPSMNRRAFVIGTAAVGTGLAIGLDLPFGGPAVVRAADGKLHKVQQAWVDNDVPQCGYCQSGMIMAVAALLKDKPSPSDADIDGAITNICRCGTYQQVREAIHAAAKA